MNICLLIERDESNFLNYKFLRITRIMLLASNYRCCEVKYHNFPQSTDVLNDQLTLANPSFPLRLL